MDKLGNDGPSSISNQWLAYELHDGLLQWLVSARMKLESQLAKSTSEPMPRSEVQTIHTFVTSALEEGRELIGFLESSVSDTHANFLQSLRDFVAKIEFSSARHELQLSIDDEGWPLLPQRTAWNLLRIVQQAISNSVQHAGECRIAVQCVREDTHLRVSISDTGIGFDCDHAATNLQPGHFGLASMQQRSKLIGAELQIHSKAGQGTTIKIALPHPSLL